MCVYQCDHVNRVCQHYDNTMNVLTCMIVAKVSRIRVLLISTSARGTTDNTSESPSASMSARSGATTVVFPAPIIICFTCCQERCI